MTKKKEHYKSALKVNEGVEQPPSLNPAAVERLKKRKKADLSIDDYIQGILKGERAILSKAITMIESNRPDHYDLAQQIVEKCLPYAGKSVRIGITGVPGVGKSTFIDTFGNMLTDLDRKVAVLAVDPSSERSGGSILGDKTRMEELGKNAKAFIRPSPSAGSLGGVARKTRETIIVCEAAGFDTILVETVGVGQSETAVYGMVDFFLLLMLAGAGDELQGIKRGIMEMCDALFITKADGSNINAANSAKVQYKNALHLLPPTESGWIPPTGVCSALTKDGVRNVWDTILEYQEFTSKKGYFDKKRKEQDKLIIYETIKEKLEQDFFNNPKIAKDLPTFEKDVVDKKLSAYTAAKKLLDSYFKRD